MSFNANKISSKSQSHFQPQIKVGVIPVAGLGTRFLPTTKSVPKELLPIVDRPGLFYVIEEFLDAGIEEIILVSSSAKKIIQDFFSGEHPLHASLAKKDPKSFVLLNQLIENRTIKFAFQEEPKGLGHAIFCANSEIAGRSFAVALPDELLFLDPNLGINPTRALIEISQELNLSSTAVMEVEIELSPRYGMVGIQKNLEMNFAFLQKPAFYISKVVEKPTPVASPSRWALPGRYVFHPEILPVLATLPPGALGEIQLSDAMNALATQGKIIGVPLELRRFDTGNKLGYLQACIELGLQNPQMGPDLKIWIQDLVKRIL